MLWDYEGGGGELCIVNSIDFDEIMAVAMETIMENKLMKERVSGRVEK
jgi:hypothetical protein